MLAEHSHVSLELANSLRKVVINRENPLLLIVSSSACFLNLTVEAVLRYYGWAYQLSTTEHKKVMGHQLPILCCQNVILSGQSLVEFISDVGLGHLEIDQYLSRKERIVHHYGNWMAVMGREKSPSNRKLAKINSDYEANRIFEGYGMFSHSSVKNERREFNIDSVFSCDMLISIAEDCPKSDADMVLRAYLCSALDEACRQKGRLVQMEERLVDHTVLMQEKPAPQVEYPRVKLNVKWFTGVFLAMTLAYIRWGRASNW